jgi:acyl-CoA synthetase (NDP forming)
VDLACLDEHVAKNLLAAAGIPALPERVVRDADQARLAAAELGCPVALKILSPDIAHKTEIGGVVLNLPTPDAAASAAMALLDRVATQRPEARLTGVLVAPMCTGGIETICGVFRDPVFGPMVMFGLGGVYVEVLKDVAFRLAPFNEDEALSMVREIRGYAILEGTRGSPPADIDALTRALSALSRFAATNPDTIAEIDINPFVVMPQGQGAFALDSLIVPMRPDEMLPAVKSQ